MSEEVMVVATELLRPYLGGNFIRDAWQILDVVADRHTFIDRALAERSAQWRQIIPYVVICNGGDVGSSSRAPRGINQGAATAAPQASDVRTGIPAPLLTPRSARGELLVFGVTRTAKQTEARLHHKVSIGIGGHINPGHTVIEGLHKELDEEVRIAGTYELRLAGVINDESTEVGRVHLGACFILEARTRDVVVVETEKMHGEWMTPAQLAAARPAMETWSQIVYDELLA